MTENQRIWDVKDMPDLPLVKLKLMRSSVHVCLFFSFEKLKWEVNGTCERQVSPS